MPALSTTQQSYPAPPRNFSKHLDLSIPKQRERLSSIRTDDEGARTRDSSLQQLWAEDYYTRDVEFEGELPEPPSAVHTSPQSICEEEYPARRPRPVQQRSLTSLFPSILSPKSKSPERKRSKSRSKSPSKTRRKDISVDLGEEGFMPTLTGDKDGVIRVEDRTRGLASWFTGSSAPVQMGIPIPAMSEEPSPIIPRDLDATPSPPSGKLRKRSTVGTSTDSTASTATTSTWRAPWAKSPSKPEPLPANLAEDELFTLDISAALFPPSSPTSAFSPSDYKNLQQSSLALLSKFQSAYQARTRAFLTLQSETEVSHEEAEEAETRVRSLRAQLEDMAQKFETQEQVIGQLVTELADEKRLRAEERDAREKSIQLIKSRAERAQKHTSASSTSSLGLGLDPNLEDLGIRQQRGKWHHNQNSHSLDLSSTSAGDSDAESLNADSVFSRSRSPTLTVSSTGPSVTGTTDSTPEIAQAQFARLTTFSNPHPNANLSPTSTSTSTSTPRPQKPPFQQQKSTFQKLLTGLTGDTEREREERDSGLGGLGLGETGCENCRGKSSSVAWDTVGLLRVENKGLKERVQGLEEGVEGALDLVRGLGLGVGVGVGSCK